MIEGPDPTKEISIVIQHSQLQLEKATLALFEKVAPK